MGVFVDSWSPERFASYFSKVVPVTAIAIAWSTCFTQYAVSQWIWFGNDGNKRPPHNAPVYLVSWIPFWYFYSVGIDYPSYTANDMGWYVYATPAVAFGGIFLNLAFCWFWSKCFPVAAPDASEDDDDLENATDAPATETPAAETPATEEVQETEAPVVAPPPKKKKPKVYYINNIKIFLTCMVILHHAVNFSLTPFWAHGAGYATEAGINMVFAGTLEGGRPSVWHSLAKIFSDIQQCYFMSLFFFWSGYFVPKSLDRKGKYVFLVERAKRIGIPMVVSTYFLNPFLRRGIGYLLLSKQAVPFGEWEKVYTHMLTGVTWFLLHLLIFGTAFTFACGEGWYPKVSCPSFWGFLGIGSILGLYGGIMCMFFSNSLPYLLCVPSFWGFYHTYALAFFGGALAQRNNWMDEIRTTMSRPLVYSVTIVSWATVLAIYLLFLTSAPFWAVELYRGFFTYGGLFAVTTSLSVTLFFMDFADKKMFCTDFFANSMYTAYVIHYPVVMPIALYCAILIYEAVGEMVYVPEANLYLGQTEYLFIPFILLVFAFAMVITWPLSYAIWLIPGVKRVM